jgi:hypothetical protein
MLKTAKIKNSTRDLKENSIQLKRSLYCIASYQPSVDLCFQKLLAQICRKSSKCSFIFVLIRSEQESFFGSFQHNKG